MDSFIFLTPFLVLLIVLPFAFVGCTFRASPGAIAFGGSDDIPLPGDYGGKGMTQPAYYRPLNNEWHIWQGDLFANQGSEVYSFQFGQDGDIPIPGDYGSGHIEPAVFRPTDASWRIFDVNTGQQRLKFNFGQPNNVARPLQDYLQGGRGRRLVAVVDNPVPGTFLENGQLRVILWRNGQFFIGDLNGNLVRPPFALGNVGDFLVPGNYGDGQNVLATFAPATNHWRSFDLTGVVQHAFFTAPYLDGDIPLPPAVFWWTAERQPVIFRSSDATWHFYSLGANASPPDQFGHANDIPVPGNYFNYGSLPAVYSSGIWEVEPAVVEGSG